MSNHKIIIFTDLDGCLLDHYQYHFDRARPLINYLKDHEIPLIFNSSKTQVEIAQIKKEMGLNTPFIVENGAAVIFDSIEAIQHFNIDPALFDCNQQSLIKQFSITRSELLLTANLIKEKNAFRYKGFSDMTAGQISELTQLSLEASMAANQRGYSEPLLWQDTQARKNLFRILLAQKGILLQEGGRFLHLNSQCSKGEAMQWLLSHWLHNQKNNKKVIALGDSKNDISMLNQSDYAIVIKNKSQKLDVRGKIKTIYSSFTGTSGWVETLTPVLNRLTNSGGLIYE